jgi:hypothetical protein
VPSIPARRSGITIAFYSPTLNHVPRTGKLESA